MIPHLHWLLWGTEPGTVAVCALTSVDCAIATPHCYHRYQSTVVRWAGLGVWCHVPRVHHIPTPSLHRTSRTSYTAHNTQHTHTHTHTHTHNTHTHNTTHTHTHTHHTPHTHTQHTLVTIHCTTHIIIIISQLSFAENAIVCVKKKKLQVSLVWFQ